MKKIMMAIAAAGLVLPAVPAVAGERDHYSREYRDRDHRYDRNVYDSRGRYKEPRRVSRNDRVWRGKDGRYYCKRSNGTTGLIIGAAGGALVGRAVDTRGDRTLGTVLGAAVGGLLGREIDRGEARCR
ncbi:MAG TPA: glycine zipper 2TM domain-containing protein [Sphingomonadaceae bacterium]|nr:glycine zipper 2TM domain-containing protein [Sphingomonadaceae bacterium]